MRRREVKTHGGEWERFDPSYHGDPFRRQLSICNATASQASRWAAVPISPTRYCAAADTHKSKAPRDMASWCPIPRNAHAKSDRLIDILD